MALPGIRRRHVTRAHVQALHLPQKQDDTKRIRKPSASSLGAPLSLSSWRSGSCQHVSRFSQTADDSWRSREQDQDGGGRTEWRQRRSQR
uniref:Uncharacterized protein n=1 Tax=Knipowitschia caucasica TaxID=637954 RepID=A0AAV2MI33_KNICA